MDKVAVEEKLREIESSVAAIRALMNDSVVITPDPPDPPSTTDPLRNNEAKAYGVGIVPVQAQRAWVARHVRHLPPWENRGKRNVYIDALRPDGTRDTNPDLRVAWTWEGRQPWESAQPVRLDKGAGEPMANIPLNKGQIMSLRIDGGGILSDVVYGVRSDHPDEGDGNTLFHHSFHIIFQRSE